MSFAHPAHDDSRPSMLRDLRVLQDFKRVCRQMGILDPDDGLIRSPQRDQPQPVD